MTKTTKKVIGFIFDENLEHVLLGQYKTGLNGISTKVKRDEMPLTAMQRVTSEKINNPPPWWHHYATLVGDNHIEYYYYGVVRNPSSNPETGITLVNPDYLSTDEKLRWLIPIAKWVITKNHFPLMIMDQIYEE